MRPILVSLITLMLLCSACNRQAEPELTTTLPGDTAPAVGSDTTTTTAETTTTTVADTETTPPAEEVESYEIVVRTGTDQGEVLWILIPSGDYDAVSLQNLLVRVVDEVEAPISEIHVFDDAAALEAGRVAADSRTEEEQALVDQHYLISVTQSNQVRYQGPFEEEGSFILGS